MLSLTQFDYLNHAIFLLEDLMVGDFNPQLSLIYDDLVLINKTDDDEEE